jgi:hypothetical protein
MTKRVVVYLFVALAAASVLGWYAFDALKNHYVRQGLDMYHSQCYNNGPGIIMNEQGTTVECRPLTKIPQKEIDSYKRVSV